MVSSSNVPCRWSQKLFWGRKRYENMSRAVSGCSVVNTLRGFDGKASEKRDPGIRAASNRILRIRNMHRLERSARSRCSTNWYHATCRCHWSGAWNRRPSRPRTRFRTMRHPRHTYHCSCFRELGLCSRARTPLQQLLRLCPCRSWVLQ